MADLAYALARAALFRLKPEQAHEATLKALEAGIYPRPAKGDHSSLRVRAFGLEFPNPLGIAAGFDKDARVPDAVLGLGCGFAEVGTVTPRAQAGNPRPRVFRLVDDAALINRLGFNNGGHADAGRRLRGRRNPSGIVGVNIGANKDTVDKAADYVAGFEAFADLASYLMVNVSSPNTPGLRDLQAPAALDELLGRIMAARSRRVADGAPWRPILVKLAPDIAADDLSAIVARLEAHAVDGIAVSNTTLARGGLREVGGSTTEAGGLSGRPLFHRSTVMLARVYRLTGGRIPLIGIGGITSAATGLDKIKAGATLLQLYTGLVYGGPGVITAIKQGLTEAAVGAPGGLAALIGQDAAAWAGKALD